MIDWANLAANGLWILGCAVILATFSYASWDASTSGEKLGARIGRPAYQVAFSLGTLLFTTGLAAAAGELFARIVWGVLGLLSLFSLILAARQARRESKLPVTPPEN